MKRQVAMGSILCALALAAALLLAIPLQGFAVESKTLENLMTAFNGESNAHAKYLAYAKAADSEGYGKVASLFRAAAEAENIHLRNHATVIKAMGGDPKAEIKLPQIRSTRENLEDAVKGETYEEKTMYPEFMKQAEKEGNKDALRSFFFAKSAEAGHAKLYGEALRNLKAWKGAKADFYVCPTCGFTVEGKPAFQTCPICRTPTLAYKLVS